MGLQVTKYGEPILRRKGEYIKEITPDLLDLIQEMLKTLEEAQGVGLAAQQVGKALQLCVIDVRPSDRPSWMKIDGESVDPSTHMPLILINPIVAPEGEPEIGPEGCLSFPDIFADIKRPGSVSVEALNEKNEKIHFSCGGLLARAVQHECDHLEGILFIDRMGYLDREDNDENLRRLRTKTKERIKRESLRRK
jgi:peptide deformylase